MVTNINNTKFKIKIANRVRFFVFIFLLVSIIIMLAFPAIMYAFNKPESNGLKQKSSREIIVIKGDTLWDIAKVYLPEKMDIRDFVHEIKAANNLESPFIMEGDVLHIPTKP